MRIWTILVVLWVAGCDVRLELLSDGGTPLNELGCPRPPDLSPAPPPCLAAKGLVGDPLLCVNFSSFTDQALTSNIPQPLKDWNFAASGPSCWEIAGNMLQIANFKMLTGDCGLFLPPLNLNDPKYSKYQSLTLSLRQRVDVDPGSQQQAGIFLDTANPARQLNATTDRNLPQQLVITLDKADLPAMNAGGYKYLLRLNAPLSAGGGRQGWQISSVAVLGNP